MGHSLKSPINDVTKISKDDFYNRELCWGFCYMCGDKNKKKRVLKKYFAPIDPITGWNHSVIVNGSPKWPKEGKWVLICDKCKPKALGLKE